MLSQTIKRHGSLISNFDQLISQEGIFIFDTNQERRTFRKIVLVVCGQAGYLTTEI